MDSLLVLRFIIVAVVVADFDSSVVRPSREAHNFRASVYLGSALLCSAKQASTVKLHSDLTRDRHDMGAPDARVELSSHVATFSRPVKSRGVTHSHFLLPPSPKSNSLISHVISSCSFSLSLFKCERDKSISVHRDSSSSSSHSHSAPLPSPCFCLPILPPTHNANLGVRRCTSGLRPE